MSQESIKVLVVDDSRSVRMILRELLNSDEQISVVGTASNGQAAIDMTRRFRPDLITMDVNMPVMDGIQAVKRIMEEMPRPIIMLSAFTRKDAPETLKALEAGAVDFIPKLSSDEKTSDFLFIRNGIIRKIKSLARIEIRPRNLSSTSGTGAVINRIFAPSSASRQFLPRIFAFGLSTGGPGTLHKILARMPADFPGAVLVAQHMPAPFTATFAEPLAQSCHLKVKEAEAGDVLKAGSVFIAPGGYNMVVNSRQMINLMPEDELHEYCPSVDMLFCSVAASFKQKATGIVLTGMGNDGSAGVIAIKKMGGLTIAQDERTSIIYGMPKSAKKTGCVDQVLAVDKIAGEMVWSI